jgi:hypothetical protein
MPQNEKNIWKLYYRNVLSDYQEVKDRYPLACLTIPPMVRPALATIRVIAANSALIYAVEGTEKDFLGKYSRELHLLVPIGYREQGCKVYGAKWVNVEQFQNEDIHFFYDKGKPIKTKDGFQLCVGTPESFPLMKNVILENIRTAENMLIAYERVMAGESETLDLIAYSHGDKGREQFKKNRKKYISKR